MMYNSVELDIGLRALIEGVSKEMIRKLEYKYTEDYFGWDNINLIQDLWDKLENHIDKGLDKENMIDIMNLSAFLWNMADAAKRLHISIETRKDKGD